MDMYQATRHILLQNKQLAVIKEGYKLNPDDCISVERFIDGAKEVFIQANNPFVIAELVADKKLLKQYYSAEIIESAQYLVYILLGIEHLLQMGDFENAEKGKAILHKKISDELKALLRV